MEITITLTTAEQNGIRSYLAEFDGVDPKTILDSEVVSEAKTRLYHALRDPREAISSHIADAEKEAGKI